MARKSKKDTSKSTHPHPGKQPNRVQAKPKPITGGSPAQYAEGYGRQKAVVGKTARTARAERAARQATTKQLRKKGEVNMASVPHQAKQGLKLVEVQVKEPGGGSHKEHRWERVDPHEHLNRPFFTAADQAKFGRDSGGQHPNETSRVKSKPTVEAALGTPEIKLRDKTDPKEVLQKVSAEAARITQQLQENRPGLRDKDAEEWGAQQAMERIPRGADRSLTDAGSVLTEVRGQRPQNLPTSRRLREGVGPEDEQHRADQTASIRRSLKLKPETGDQATYDKWGRVLTAHAEANPSRNASERIKAKQVKEVGSTRGGPPRLSRTKFGEGKGLESDIRGTGKSLAPLTAQQKRTTQSKSGGKTLTPGAPVAKGKLSNQQFLRTLSPEEEKWVDKQMEYGGMFFGAKGNKVPGAYRRWQRYSSARQAGYKDRDNIVEWLTTDTRGRRTTNPDRRFREDTDKIVQGSFKKGLSKPKGRAPKERYGSQAPSHEEFGVGIRVPGIPSDSQFKDMFPDASDQDLVQIKESTKQSLEDQFFQNQRETHEQRQAALLGRDKGESSIDNKDRVVFFTTSTGWPAVSVAANSLVGQYIIKKRKRMIYDQKGAPRAALHGEFPYAVRDQHLTEVATGVSVGAQGRYGAFRHMGYRVGSKKSKGYGKILPVGSQILRDSSGQAIYDSNGNVRYTEGFTRPFDVRPGNEVGLRVYVG